jgi:cytidine deaminase
MPTFQFDYEEFLNDESLSVADRSIMLQAREAVNNAHAPYSKFKVGAVVLLQNGEVICGVNIENASYPVGICAERSALASAISQFPNQKIETIAISYLAPSGENLIPAFPCGMCRQFISECEDRNHAFISLLLGAQQGKIIKIKSIKNLLPFSFSGSDLG